MSDFLDESDALRLSTEYFGGDKMAADIFVKKYALRDKTGQVFETTPDMMHRRLAGEFARIESKYSNPLSEEEIYNLFKNFKRIIPQGSPMSGIGNPYSIQSFSNCFVIEGAYDSYASINRTDDEMTAIMKRRGGVGHDVSRIRPKNMPVSNAAGSTDGIAIFLDQFSDSTRRVAQGGRRGALMLTIDVRHPEIETFINIKRDKTRVTGANMSIRMTDAFMQAVKDDADFTLQWPCEVPVAEAKITRVVRAKEIWNQVIDAAWDNAEPGVLFWDTVKRWTPSDAYTSLGYGSISTNPCIVGSTLIATADGRNAVSIRKLAEIGIDVPVYSTNVESGKVEIKLGRSPRKTKENTEVWKLTLDDGTTLIATPDHKIMLLNREYVNLKDLKVGDSLFPFNTFNSNGYRQIRNTGASMKGGARRNKRQYRLIHEYFCGETDSRQFDIHHVDFDGINDRPENLLRMKRVDHQKLHSEKMLGENNPYHRMTDDWKRKFATHSGASNGRAINVSNEELLLHAKTLFQQNGKLTAQMWHDYAKENGLPQFLSNDFRFGSWQNFANQVTQNHKVASVEFCGYEDVYNITVDDNHNYHVITSHDDERFVTSSGLCVKNCGEIVLSAYDACRLVLVNVLTYVKNQFLPSATFDFDEFASDVVKAQRLMDDLVDLEIEAIDRIIEKVKSDPEPEEEKIRELTLWQKVRAANVNARRTGLGITALGDAIAALGVKYGSEDSIAFTEVVYSQLAISAHQSSVKLAEERGAFPIHSHKLEKGHPFFERLRNASKADVNAMYDKFGRRNICLTTTAPAGSVSTQTQTTSGIEPTIFLDYVRSRKVNPNDTDARVDRIDALGDKWQEYRVYHHGVAKWMEATGETDITKSPYFGTTCNEIDWVASVDVQAAAQKWVEHSISKTCNLPRDVSKQVVSDCYMRAWELGCKGFTVYREGSRDAVIVDASKEKKAEKETITENHAPKRAKELQCEIHHVKVVGESWTILVGLSEQGKPYEIFGGLTSLIEIPKKIKFGRLAKSSRQNGITTYNLVMGAGDDELKIKDVVSVFDNKTQGAFTRTISLALRHGVPLQFICEQLVKDKHSDMQSFSRVISRVLKTYIVDGTKAGQSVCESCQANGTLVYAEKCISCVNCGWSKCS